MQRQQPHAENLLGRHQVPQVRARKVAASITVAPGIERTAVRLEARRFDVDLPFPLDPNRAVAAVARGRHAVEHVDAARDRLDQVVGIAYTHQVARVRGRQLGLQHLEHLVHARLGLAHRQPADRDAVPVRQLEYPARGVLPQVGENRALQDREKGLLRPVTLAFQLLEVVAAALQPAQRPLVRLFRDVACRLAGWTLVERHDDVRAQRPLRFHHAFRREQMARPVDMALKLHPGLAHLVDFGQTEHLKTAAVGQDRPVPVHEPVQPAHRLHHLRPRPQKQMVGVGQHDLGAGAFDLLGRERFDRGLRADRHEGRRVQCAVREMQRADAGGACGVRYGELKHYARWSRRH